ncbi:hypothetical protein SAMN05444380_11577 [Thermophagus xiamenensis]|uniref:Uncharacterized protein n=1 Tax=Thermophagus xiamenensis TaxID=385682 RepID=A0A1I2CC81_9BACT|nr:hypothetical protein SAMN05444380_11577 [Thermophagus xiamenensis]
MRSSAVCFNRTIVELKSNKGSWLSRSWCFNRTIVELKCNKKMIIVILLSCFNRTIVELKYVRNFLWHIHILLQSNHSGIEIKKRTTLKKVKAGFNRTIVELKCSYERVLSFPSICFNRTIVELKLMYSSIKNTYRQLQSNHSGIEIKRWTGTDIMGRWLLQSNHSGIEIFSKSGCNERFPGFNRTIVELK